MTNIPSIERLSLPLPQTRAEHKFLRHCKRTSQFPLNRSRQYLINKVAGVFYQFVKLLIQVGIFLLQPNLYGFGFIAGIIWDDTCSYALDRIKAVWNNFTFIQTIGAVLASIVAMPVVILTGYFLYAASMGSNFHHELDFE